MPEKLLAAGAAHRYLDLDLGSSRQSGVRAGLVARVLSDGLVSAVFQPIVDISTGRTFAFEALARCSAKELKSPIVLFESAVDEKLCGQLGRAIRVLATDGCPDHPLFLNVHPHELADRWLVQPDDPIFTHGPGVYLELTESVPLSHYELVKLVLREVRSKGVGLVVDDLGAGYSNLRYIADLEPEVVKLDRGLVAGLESDHRRQRVVAGIARMCEDLGADVVAEGIETLPELIAVRDVGVRFGQGYFLARPTAAPVHPTEEVLAQFVVDRRRGGPVSRSRASANGAPSTRRPTPRITKTPSERPPAPKRKKSSLIKSGR